MIPIMGEEKLSMPNREKEVVQLSGSFHHMESLCTSHGADRRRGLHCVSETWPEVGFNWATVQTLYYIMIPYAF